MVPQRVVEPGPLFTIKLLRSS